jgi:hypothetical protein
LTPIFAATKLAYFIERWTLSVERWTFLVCL